MVVYNEMVQEGEEGVKSRDFPIVALDFERPVHFMQSVLLYTLDSIHIPCSA